MAFIAGARMIAGMLGLGSLALGWWGCYLLARGLAARKHLDADWRVSWLLACAGWGASLVALTELSSLFARFDRPILLVGWIALASGTWIIGLRLARSAGLKPGGSFFFGLSTSEAAPPDWWRRSGSRIANHGVRRPID